MRGYAHVAWHAIRPQKNQTRILAENHSHTRSFLLYGLAVKRLVISTPAMAGETTPLLPRFNGNGSQSLRRQTKSRSWIKKAVLVVLSIIAFALWLMDQGPPSGWSWFAPPPEPIYVAVVGTFYPVAYNAANAVVSLTITIL
jgi:hypothetical protein